MKKITIMFVNEDRSFIYYRNVTPHLQEFSSLRIHDVSEKHAPGLKMSKYF